MQATPAPPIPGSRAFAGVEGGAPRPESLPEAELRARSGIYSKFNQKSPFRKFSRFPCENRTLMTRFAWLLWADLCFCGRWE